MIRILHLSYCDKNTGAGIAAKRIHNSICDYNDKDIKSLLRINTPGRNNLNTISTKKSISIFYNFVKKYLERIIVKILRFDDNVFHSISALPSLKHNEINNLEIDLVHIHWVQHETISIEEVGKIKVPIVWTLHDCWPFSATEHYQRDNLDQRYIRGYKVKNFFNFSEYIDKLCFFRKKFSWKNEISLIAPSKWISDCAQNSLLMKDRKIVVIPNTINTKIFKPLNKKSARKSLKLKTNKKIILFGSIDGGEDPRKGSDLLVDFLKYLTFNKEDIQIVIFGKKNKSQNIFKDTNFEIINLGKINSINKMSIIYSAADVYIIPSRIESFGQTAAEAQSCGTPVAGFNIGGLKDIITHNENGILYSKEEDNLLEIIRKLNKSDIDKITKNSKNYVNTNYSIENSLNYEFRDYKKITK